MYLLPPQPSLHQLSLEARKLMQQLNSMAANDPDRLTVRARYQKVSGQLQDIRQDLSL